MMKLISTFFLFGASVLLSSMGSVAHVAMASSLPPTVLPQKIVSSEENKSQMTVIGVPMQSLASGMHLPAVSPLDRRTTDEQGLPVQPATEDVPIRSGWLNGSMGVCACTLDVLSHDALKKPLGQTSLRDVNGRKFAVSVLSFSLALDIFHKLDRALKIPRGALNDGCFARAHEMSFALEKIGILTGKIMATGHFQILSDLLPKRKVNWGFHVAPIVVIDDGTSRSVWVLDPALFAEPVPLESWLQLLAQHPHASFRDVFFTNRFVMHPDQRNQDHSKWRKQDLAISRKLLRAARIKFASAGDKLRTASRSLPRAATPALQTRQSQNLNQSN